MGKGGAGNRRVVQAGANLLQAVVASAFSLYLRQMPQQSSVDRTVARYDL